jgi:hypothetical protein
MLNTSADTVLGHPRGGDIIDIIALSQTVTSK